MPELPEVEFAARKLTRWCLNRRIIAVAFDPHAQRLFRPAGAETTGRLLVGKTFRAVERIGKQILITLSGDRHRPPVGLVSHLGMTGKWVRGAPADTPHVRASFRLDRGSLVSYVDPRMFGRLRVVQNARFDTLADLAALGPDPLRDGIDSSALARRFAATRRAIKVAMLDQTLLPGIGNIQASESLFRAGIHPARLARDLTRSEVSKLSRAILASIRATLAREVGDEITYVEEAGAPNPFRVYGHAGERCPRCRAATIARLVQAQRASFYCPRCQPRDAPSLTGRAARR